MSAKPKNIKQIWTDPDEAPELTDDFFEQGEWKIDDNPVSMIEGVAALRKAVGRPKADRPKLALTVRYDADIVEAFRATGKGWQSRMNVALRHWLDTHSLHAE